MSFSIEDADMEKKGFNSAQKFQSIIRGQDGISKQELKQKLRGMLLTGSLPLLHQPPVFLSPGLPVQEWRCPQCAGPFRTNC